MTRSKKGPDSVSTGGGAFVGGSVNTAGGDFVGRDQVKTLTQHQEGASVADLMALLTEVRALLPGTGLDPDTARVIEGDFRVVEEQAAKATPKGGLITSRLKGIAELIQQGGKATDALERIGTLLGKAIAMAAALF